jgi:ribokinase
MDLVVQANRFPQPGETILGGEFGMFPGGKGANQAVACAKLGGNVYFLGKMGMDLFREKLVEGMSRDGVKLDHLLTDRSSPTGIALITVSGSGQNEIVVASGSNMQLRPSELTLHSAAFERAAVVLLQLEIPLPAVQRAVRMAKQYGATVILNPAPARKLPASLLKQIDILTPNETELAILTGLRVDSMTSVQRAARKLVSIGVANVIVTMGSQGSFWLNGADGEHYRAMKVKAVDTTGAGDAFNGALAYSIANGQSIDDAIRFASSVAAFSVTKMGAQSSMPTTKELRAFAKNGRR